MQTVDDLLTKFNFDVVGDILPKSRGKFFDVDGNVVSITQFFLGG